MAPRRNPTILASSVVGQDGGQPLIEADECEIAHGETEERGITMFVRYTVIPHTVVDVVATYTTPPAAPTLPPHDPGKPPALRLVR